MPFFGVPIRNGLPIGLGSVAGFGVQQFDPSQLFEGGTVAGAWYDPSDLSTMFTTDAGTTPVAMPGQGAGVAVGLILDKSGNGNHARSFGAGLSSTRPELRARVNLLVATATLSTQSVTTQATSYTLSFAGTGSITLSGTATGSYSAGTHTITCTAGTLTLTVSGTVTTADLRPANSGALLPAYQAVVNADTYDTNGFPLYLQFDGLDDIMTVPGSASAMKFMHSALSSVCLGANVGNSADPNAVYAFFGSNALASANVGAICVYDDRSVFSNNNALRNFTTNGVSGFPTISTLDQNVLLPITPNVVFYNSDPANATAANRYTAYVNNGSALATNTATDAASTANSTYDLQVGSNGNSLALALMSFYGLVIVNATITGGQRTATQSWIAGKMGITLP